MALERGKLEGRRPAWSSIPRPMPIRGASIRKRKRSTPSLAASARRAAAMLPARKKEHARLVALRDVAKERKLGYWVEQIDIQADVVRGLPSVAEGKRGRGYRAPRKPRPRARMRPRSTSSYPDRCCRHARCWPTFCSRPRKASEALREFEAVLGQGAEPLSRHRRSGQGGAPGRRRKEGAGLQCAAVATSERCRCAAQARADQAIEQSRQPRPPDSHRRGRGAKRLQHGVILERPGHGAVLGQPAVSNACKHRRLG